MHDLRSKKIDNELKLQIWQKKNNLMEVESDIWS